LHFVSYNPIRDKPTESPCFKFDHVDKIVEWFFVHDRLLQRFELVTREVAPPRVTKHAGCELNEGIDPDIESWVIGKRRLWTRKPTIPWSRHIVDHRALSVAMMAALKNASFTSRG
jgi:hypothetical protein